MIPNINLSHGRKLNDKEKESLYVELQQSTDFQKVISKVKKFNTLLNQEKVFRSGNIFEFVDDNNNLIVGTRIVFQIGENSLFLYQKTKSEEIAKVEVMAATKVLTKDETKLVTIFIDGEEVVEVDGLYSNNFNQDFDEGLPDLENYVQGQSLNEVQPQYNWGDGCYPLYKHCGRNCGDKGKYGGGTPKNAYDTCCRTHDRCWENFGVDDCQCDCQFIACAKKNFLVAPAVLHAIVLSYFPRKSGCKC